MDFAITLQRPAEAYRAQIAAYKQEILALREDVSLPEACERYLDHPQEQGEDAPVNEAVFLAIRKADGALVGVIQYRRLTDDYLRSFAGSCGGNIRPVMRGNGYAAQMLTLLLPLAKSFGEESLLLTCDKKNIASAKTLVSCGGKLESEVIDTVGVGKSGVIQRYRIML